MRLVLFPLPVLFSLSACEVPNPELSGSVTDQSVREATLVATPDGELAGTTQNGVARYLGVPFAAPPARWRLAGPVEPWEGTRAATEFPPPCPQLENSLLESGDVGTFIGDEDCLHLNIWVPEGSSEQPVLLFVHGGAFETGSTTFGGDPPLYDGERLAAATGQIVVVIQYRLGPLGFLAHPGLSDEGVTGNHGLSDQQAAFRWVRDNIASFGGDPNRVTLFGESAGAISIGSHLAAPDSAGLFHRAILESGWGQSRPLAEAVDRHAQIIADVGCDPNDAPQAVRTCLEAVDPETLLRAVPAWPIQEMPIDLNFMPVIDGVYLTGPTIETFRSDGIPVIVGQNREEIPGLVFEGGRDTWLATIEEEFPPSLQAEAKLLYSPLRYGSYRGAVGALATDITFTCPQRTMLRRLEGTGHDTYRYLFPFPNHLPVPAFHGLELLYVFQRSSDLDNLLSSRRVERNFAHAWGAMAENGRPTLPGLLPWPRHGRREAHVVMSSWPAIGYGYKSPECNLLDTASESL